VLAHRGCEAVGERDHPVAHLRVGKSPEQLLVGGARAGEAQVVGDRGVEDVGVLLAQANGAPDVVARQRPQVRRPGLADELQRPSLNVYPVGYCIQELAARMK
jgi:hypothetical protein